jgi:Nucleotide modification associated domain 3
MKALLLRVGIDKGYGALSPVFSDNAYRYIPVYYKDKTERESKEKRDFRDIHLDDYLPPSLHNKKIHLDPEFETFTYGDPGWIKRGSLLKLSKGDLLVFYIGGKYLEGDEEEGCFIVGYFVVKGVIDWNTLSHSQRDEVKNIFARNAHIMSSKSKNNLVLVKGSKESKALTHCIPITVRNKKASNPPYFTSPEIQRLLGIRSYIVRAVPIWIHDVKHLENLRELLTIGH